VAKARWTATNSRIGSAEAEDHHPLSTQQRAPRDFLANDTDTDLVNSTRPHEEAACMRDQCGLNNVSLRP